MAPVFHPIACQIICLLDSQIFPNKIRSAKEEYDIDTHMDVSPLAPRRVQCGITAKRQNLKFSHILGNNSQLKTGSCMQLLQKEVVRTLHMWIQQDLPVSGEVKSLQIEGIAHELNGTCAGGAGST